MGYRAASWIPKTAILTATGWGLFAIGHRCLAQTVASSTVPATLAAQNLWLIAALLSLWLFIPLIATVIISILAFRISPSEAVEAEGDNVINVMPGLKFKARGPMASFIILLALSSLIVLTQIGNVIPTLDNQIEIDQLQSFLELGLCPQQSC